MKRVLPAIALIAGLTLAGCSGTDSAKDSSAPETKDAAAEETTEAAAPAKQLTEDQLKSIVDSTKAGSASFKSLDAGASAEALGAGAEMIKDAEISPAECKAVTMGSLNAAQASNGTTVAGISSDNAMSVGLSSFADEKAVSDQFSNSSSAPEKCKEVTLNLQGTEMKISYETFDATVEGADETIGLKSTSSAAGQPGVTTSTVVSRVGTNIVSVVNMTPGADDQVAIDGAGAFVEAVKNAG